MNRNSKTKKMILNSILIAVGALLHQITPAIGLPMQPDFSLVMLFIIIIINEDYKTTLLSALIIGIFTALTTKFPAGQIPNIVDKLLTANIIYLILLPIKNKVSNNIKIIISLIFGTIISGLVFLTSAQFLVGLPSSFMDLVKVVVIPTMVMNSILGTVLYKAIQVAFRVTNIKILN